MSQSTQQTSSEKNSHARSSDADAEVPKKRRKQRPRHSCDECRRLKMKCDRQAPCANCVRRGRVDFCTWPPEHAPQLQHQQTPPRPVSRSTQQASVANQSQLDRLALVANVLEPYTVNGPPAVSSTTSPNPPLSSADHDGEQGGSHGTLMLSKGGRAKYLGPTAGSEWLKDSETQDATETPLITRAPSPETQNASRTQPGNGTLGSVDPIAFPFNVSSARIRTRDLLSQLPPRDEAWSLVESYYRYCAWHHDVAPKSMFEPIFHRVYAFSEGRSSTPAVNPQEIALVFIILAQGTIFNIEMPSYDPSVEEWLHLSERALVKGDFLSNNMLAGVQTLHLMAHLHLHLDKGRRGDNAWPLWGLVMRLVQAMGMHRDGARWNLPEDVVEERRKVFWECNSADTFQAHCFSRPSAIQADHCDTAFPAEPLNLNGEKGYSTLRFELSQLSSEILNMAMKVRKPPYSDVMTLDARLCEFERNLPFSIRCRAALMAMPSRYPQIEAAIEASPEPSRRAMTASFQQTNLAVNISETIINLHRPYYAKALYDDMDSGVRSPHAPSFLTVVERCAIIIAIVGDIHARFPAVSIRQWSFWFHVFNSALCLGTLVLRDPANAMSAFALTQIDSAITLFRSLTQRGGNTPRYYRNLQWLLKLRSRASSKISTGSNAGEDTQAGGNNEEGRGSESRDEGDDVELLGWRTRLIERADRNHQTIRTVHLAATPANSHITQDTNPPFPNHTDLAEVGLPSLPVSSATYDPTDDLLHDFWDPLLLQDVFQAYEQSNQNFANNTSAWWEEGVQLSNGI